MAAVRLSRLQTRILRWFAADEQRTRGMSTSSHPELGAALPSAQGAGTAVPRMALMVPWGAGRSAARWVRNRTAQICGPPARGQG